jgi:hypothetical protein
VKTESLQVVIRIVKRGDFDLAWHCIQNSQDPYRQQDAMMRERLVGNLI